MTTFPAKGLQEKELKPPKRGQTEIFELDFQAGGNININDTPVPGGIAYDDFVHARTGSFWLKIKGNDCWVIDHYQLLGYFKELRQAPETDNAFQTIDHGWLLIAHRDKPLNMSADSSEGRALHLIELNGTFTAKI